MMKRCDMNYRLFDFECVKGHRHELLVDKDVRIYECSTCGLPANRMVSAPRCKLEGFSGAFPTAADKWVNDRESHMKRERKNVERHGTYK